MTFHRIEKLLSQEDRDLLRSLSSDKIDKPILLHYLCDIISDDEIYAIHLSDEVMEKLFRLAKEYFNNCWGFYLGDVLDSTGLEKLIQYSELVVYNVYAANGKRVATANEVKNGVAQLEPDITKVIDDDAVMYLNLLLWTFTGKIRYYGKSGLSFSYTDGKLDDTQYQLIIKAGQKLRGMIDWLNVSGNYDRAIAALKLAKKNSKYKYPTFAEDEITDVMPFKQLCYMCKAVIIGRGETDNQIETKKLLYRIDKDNYKPTPYEISIMRKAYNEVKTGEYTKKPSEIPADIQLLCDRLTKGAEDGLVNKYHFAFKIIGTVTKYGKCSEKQLNILKEAEKELDDRLKKQIKEKKKDEENKNESDESLDNELLDMYDALSSGMLED